MARLYCENGFPFERFFSFFVCVCVCICTLIVQKFIVIFLYMHIRYLDQTHHFYYFS
jgi:hypothetical protein